MNRIYFFVGAALLAKNCVVHLKPVKDWQTVTLHAFSFFLHLFGSSMISCTSVMQGMHFLIYLTVSHSPVCMSLFVCPCLCCGLIYFQSTVIPLYEPLHYYKCKFCTSAVVALYFVLFFSHFVNDLKKKHKGVHRTCPHMQKQKLYKNKITNYKMRIGATLN